MNLVLILTITLLVRIADCGFADNDAGLDFDFEDDVQPSSQNSHASKEQALQDTLLRAMQKPAVREQIGQVIPILRAMSPQQRLTLAALVSAQIMSPQHADQQNINHVASLFGAPGESTKNVSEKLLLPISMDIAKMFRGIAGDAGRSWRSAPWERRRTDRPMMQQRPYTEVTMPPTPQTYNFTVSKGSLWKSQSTTSGPNDINRRNDIDEDEESPDSTDCEFFTSDMCLEVAHYPEAEILVSIQKQMPLMESFLSEFGDLKNEAEAQQRIQRRRDGGNELGSGEGFMCPSTVKYAKPKRARTTSGFWKYVVNTGEYTQTLRLEMCTKPGASCSYLNDNFRSVCNQVYNYHRLMTWDEKRGLHMDVFKVPSCCSCHVQGYSTRLPPNDYPFAEKRKEVLPIQQSNSGVKREIPRPGRPGGPAQFQNLHSHSPPKNVNQQASEFSIEQSISEYHHYPSVPQAQAPTLPPQNVIQHVPSPELHTTHSSVNQNRRFQQQSPNQQHHSPIGPPKLNQQLPRYPASNFNPNPNRPFNPQNFHIQPNSQPNFPLQRQPNLFQNNLDVQGSNSIQNTVRSPVGLVDHLVPPGPPLPLEHEKTPFDQRRRNITNRYQENSHQHIGKNFHNRIPDKNEDSGMAIPISIPVPMPLPGRPNRPSNRPLEQPRPMPIQPQDSNRTPFKPAENIMFGSKLRGKKPQRPSRPVFVTPTPLTEETRNDLDNAIKVTPKPSKMHATHPSKKINYNYHPIIDFFSKDAQLTERQFHVQPSQMHHQQQMRGKHEKPHPQQMHIRSNVQHQHQNAHHRADNNLKPQQINLQQDAEHNQENMNTRQQPKFPQQQIFHPQETKLQHDSQAISHQQHVQSEHEWTPML